MSCLAQCLLGSVEEEDDWGSQADVSIGNESPSCFQHYSHRCCTIRRTCQKNSRFTPRLLLLAASLYVLASLPTVAKILQVWSRIFPWYTVHMTV